MIQIKAEFRKLFSVRSTYILTILAWLVAIVMSFIVGYKGNNYLNPSAVQDSIFGVLRFVGLISAIVSILLLAHEYRYNTINYSFTLGNSRSRVLASKFIVLSVYSIVLGLVSVFIVLGCFHFGVAARGHQLVPQVFNVIGTTGNYWPGLLLQSAFYVWGMSLAALIVTALLRNLVASIAFIFVFPGLENLTSLISKTLTSYMPFTDLGAVLKLDRGEIGFSAGKSMIIFLIYLAVFSFIAWRLFLKRDAN